jgi:hypothetical protein
MIDINRKVNSLVAVLINMAFVDASQYLKHNPNAYRGKERDVQHMALKNMVIQYLKMDMEQEKAIHEMVEPMERHLFGDLDAYLNGEHMEHGLNVILSNPPNDMITGPCGNCICSTCQDMDRASSIWDGWYPIDPGEIYIKKIVEDVTK